MGREGEGEGKRRMEMGWRVREREVIGWVF